jgi:hypothetical protein
MEKILEKVTELAKDKEFVKMTIALPTAWTFGALNGAGISTLPLPGAVKFPLVVVSGFCIGLGVYHAVDYLVDEVM